MAEDRLVLKKEHELKLLSEKMQALSPLFPLKKGYALVRDMAGNAVRDASMLSKGDRLALSFHKGKAIAEVMGTESAAAGKQDSLFLLPKSKGRTKNRIKKQENPDQETLW